MEKYLGIYRIPTARLQSWDYGNNAAYFITICTNNRKHYFGKIVEGVMHLNALGKLAHTHWLKILEDYNFVELGSFVVMPNHFHGILIINKEEKEPLTPEEYNAKNLCLDEKRGGITRDKNPMMNENISQIIRRFKGRCAFEMCKINPEFAWQSRFHDHIIRNIVKFELIQNYIETNSLVWEKDKFYTNT